MKKYLLIKGILILIGIIVLLSGCGVNQHGFEVGVLVLKIYQEAPGKTYSKSFRRRKTKHHLEHRPMDIATFDITGDGPLDDSFSILGFTELTVVQLDLSVGTWIITVDAKNEDGAIIGIGVTTVDVMKSELTMARVKITPLTEAGPLSVGISWPDSVFNVSYVTGTLGVEDITFDSIGTVEGDEERVTASFTAEKINEGYYPLIVQLWDMNTVVGGAFEAVKVVSNYPVIEDIDANNPLEEGIELVITPDIQNPITTTLSGVPESGILSMDSSMTVTAMTDPGDPGTPEDPDDLQFTYQWYLNGELQNGETGTSIILTGGTEPVDVEGNYRLDFVVFYGGTISSENVQFSVQTSSWEVVGEPRFSAGAAEYVSLFVDHETPYVAYKDLSFFQDDEPKKYRASVMKFNVDSEKWENVGTAGFSAGEVWYTSLFIDDIIGTPYVAYKDGGNSNKATVMMFNGDEDSWENVGTAGFSASEVWYTSLFIDDIGTPYVAYRDLGSYPTNKATVMNYTVMNYNADWAEVDVAGFSAAEVDYTSLYVDVDSGIPYVAYKDNSTDPAGKATVMKFNVDSEKWENVGTAGFSAAEVDYTSLYVDVDSGIPYVAYKDNSTDPAGKATVMKFNVDSEKWENVGTAGFSAGVADYTSLYMYKGAPYVAYSDGENSGGATVMKFNVDSEKWENVGTAGFSAGAATYTSLFIDDIGIPYVAYQDQDGGNSNGVTVMKFIN